MDTKLHVIGVAYDGSAEADAALEVAVQLATDVSAALQLIGVFERHPVPPGIGMTGIYAVPATDESCRDALLYKLEDAAESVPPELRAAVVLVNGDPAEQLIRRAAPLSLLVIGSHGRGPLRRALLGSISSRVLRHAECPVLVVPRRAKVAAAA